MTYYHDKRDVRVLNGKVLAKIESSDDVIVFHTADNETYRMYHDQECCESVYIEDICGNLNDLIGSPILMAEEVSEDRGQLNNYEESYTWTFYKFATNRGSVTIRWYGMSNGYYSESVDFVKVG